MALLATAFQFLMVRLKDFFSRCPTGIQAISIPYGAIKSYANNGKLAGTYVISIPYGAIKSKLPKLYR